jgi:dihydrofolate synthase/folylpolyglutamate synthase
MISKDELTELVERLKPAIEDYNKDSEYGALSFFEVYTALAFIYFKENKVDFAVLETGLGGRLDATNTVDSLISAITPISYEHTRQLGKALTKIAYEKAGIIKAQSAKRKAQNLIVITAPQEKEAIEVIRDKCKKQGAILYEIGRDIIFQKQESRQDYQCFNINGVFGRLTDLKIRLLGRHQIINATTAVAVILALSKFYRTKIPNGVNVEAIKNGLYNTIWPGRFEIILERPSMVLDGAQNFASAQALKEAIIENFPDNRIILVLGISQDKDMKGICQALLPISAEVILTRADNPRAADVDGIEQVISYQLSVVSPQITKTRRVEEAIELAKRKAKYGDLILVTGSLFLVGEARELLKIGGEY